MTDRIELAKAMGWKRVTLKTFGGDDSNVWESPTGTQSEGSLPDPENDANDCHALIKHLNGLGFYIYVRHNVPREYNNRVTIGSLSTSHKDWQGDNWMHGVCELALKVIE